MVSSITLGWWEGHWNPLTEFEDELGPICVDEMSKEAFIAWATECRVIGFKTEQVILHETGGVAFFVKV